VLSLYPFKTFPSCGAEDAGAARRASSKLDQMNQDYRRKNLNNDQTIASPKLDRFWEGWKDYYGKTGFVNPRGDRLLTTLALRSLRELRPKLMMINYNDPDYVHWGPPNFYTRAISIIDDGVQQLYDAVQADAEYRDNTVFFVIPDCGRDNNLCQSCRSSTISARRVRTRSSPSPRDPASRSRGNRWIARCSRSAWRRRWGRS
jgi:hypothetical protein